MIIPGPNEPALDSISHYLTPIIDNFVIGWERGIHISQTASSPNGIVVELAIILSINDLPAARKIAGAMGVRSSWLCTLCKLFGRSEAYRTNFDSWETRDFTIIRQQAEAHRDAQTQKEKDALFEANGVRWSELWRLPYWDPTRMLVVDSMHAMLEGLVHYHCCHVLKLDSKVAKAAEKIPMEAAFSYPWPAYDDTYNDSLKPEQKKFLLSVDDEDQVLKIQEILQLPFESEQRDCLDEEGDCLDEQGDSNLEGCLNEETLIKKLDSKRLAPLRYVCVCLKLSLFVIVEDTKTEAKQKKHFISILIDWVSTSLVYVLAKLTFLTATRNASSCA
jgi:hypothetical protein